MRISLLSLLNATRTFMHSGDKISLHIHCLNCEAHLLGAYCHACGQSAQTERLAIRRMVADLAESLANLEMTPLRTLRQAVIRPDKVAEAYIEGRRVGLSSPLRYYVTLIALNIALVGVIDEVILESNSGSGSFWDKSFVAAQIAVVFVLLLIPVAVVSRLVRLKQRMNVIEHYAFLLYIVGNSVLAVAIGNLVAAVLFQRSLGASLELLLFAGPFLLYLAAVGPHFYRESRWRMLWNLVLTMTASVVALLVMTMLVVAVG